MTPAPGTLQELVDLAADDLTCVVHEGRVWRFGGLRRLSKDVAGLLRDRGVRRGDRVALWLHNCPEWIATVLACARLGAVAVSVNTRFGSKEVGDLIARTACKALVFAPLGQKRPHAEILVSIDAHRRRSLETLLTVGASPGEGSLGGVPLVAFADIPAAGDVPAEGRPEDGCIVFTTSGTTSAPKLVLHAQERICRHAADVSRSFEFAREDTRILQAVPLAGVFGFSLAVTALHAGKPLVLMTDFRPEQAVSLLREHAVTNMIGTDDMLDKMLAVTDDPSAFRSLRFYGHANFNPGLKDLGPRAEGRGVVLRGLFGMSETFALFAIQPADAPLERRVLAGGIPVSSAARVRATDPETQRHLPHGEAGEIEISSPNLMLGYLDDPAATERAFADDGFFRTGDLGYTTEDGGFIHLSRMGYVRRISGYLVNPREIEDVILEGEGLEACQVVEVSRPEGTRPVAFVILRPGADFDEARVMVACRKSLASFKVPIRVFPVPAFPMVESANGLKVKRTELRRMATDLLAAGAPARADGP